MGFLQEKLLGKLLPPTIFYFYFFTVKSGAPPDLTTGRFGTAAHCGAAGGLENGARIFMVSASKDSIGL